jgi:hypothetical protein|tara:strand:- start:180 stop:551 length:372 start_codon:yes stop_codon:yes gene_type:complete
MAREYKKVYDEIRRDTEAGKIEKQLDKVSPKYREQLKKELEEEAKKKKQQKLKSKIKRLRKKRQVKKEFRAKENFPGFTNKEVADAKMKELHENKRKRKGSGGRGGVPLSNTILKGGFGKKIY